MDKARVVITGIGALTPLGNDIETTWKNLLAGKSGAAPVTLFDTEGMSVRFGCEVKNFDPDAMIGTRETKRMDRFAQLAVAASIQSVKHSGLDLEKADRTRIGCIMASGIGGLLEMEEQHTRYVKRGPRKTSPFFVPKMMLNAAAGHIAIHFGLGGPNWGVASACASANHAMGSSLRTLQYGDADVMITGGTEAALTGLGLNGFANMKALSTRNDDPEKASRPFDKNRDGFVLGEGAAVFVFETLDHAKKRGAKIYAEVLGIGNSDDAYHLTAPDPDGSGGARAMKNALNDAGLKPGDISYINAHGTSTPLNDRTETLAMKHVFGDALRKIPVSSTKSMIGHLLGAAAAAELAATVLMIRDRVIHPTINYETPDPECELDVVPNEKRTYDIEYAMSNSLGFGGHNSAIIVGRYN